MSGCWMNTWTGRRFEQLRPDARDVCLADIAHSLARKCRYNGHVDDFYSVAEHSVLLSRMFQDPDERRLALLHDAAEAYWPDIHPGVKAAVPALREYEEAIDATVRHHFGLPKRDARHLDRFHAALKELDGRILLDERDAQMSCVADLWEQDLAGCAPLGCRILALDHAPAERLFLVTATTLGLRGAAEALEAFDREP